MEQVLAEIIPATVPLNPNFDEDPNVPFGSTWVDQPFSPGNPTKFYRIYSLGSWKEIWLALEITPIIQREILVKWLVP